MNGYVGYIPKQSNLLKSKPMWLWIECLLKNTWIKTYQNLEQRRIWIKIMDSLMWQQPTKKWNMNELKCKVYVNETPKYQTNRSINGNDG